MVRRGDTDRILKGEVEEERTTSGLEDGATSSGWVEVGGWDRARTDDGFTQILANNADATGKDDADAAAVERAEVFSGGRERCTPRADGFRASRCIVDDVLAG